MGCNYYAKIDPCPHCGRADKVLHIGKSSAGWCFSLHVGDGCPNDLEEWKVFLAGDNVAIEDEYSRPVTLEELLSTITERTCTRDPAHVPHMDKYTEMGSDGLMRHRIGQFCVSHGEGTWDLIPGEFS